MRRWFISLASVTALCIFPSAGASAGASAETREAYLARLKEICAADCLQPRDFQRRARKQGAGDTGEMAIIMDVAYVTRDGSTYQLHNLDRENSYFDDLQLLGSAGINTSSRDGIGGLPRGRSNPVHPDLIVIELDEATARELLGASKRDGRAIAGAALPAAGPEKDGSIIVEGDAQTDAEKPSAIDFRSFLRGRRIVVRGTPRLTPVWIGARMDQRRKQVTLELSNADDLVLLPRYDEKGEPLAEDLPWRSAGSRQTGD